MLYPQTLAGMKGQLAAVRAHDTYDRLSKISAPTLVIAGDADMLVDARNSPILASRIRGAKLDHASGTEARLHGREAGRDERGDPRLPGAGAAGCGAQAVAVVTAVRAARSLETEDRHA